MSQFKKGDIVVAKQTSGNGLILAGREYVVAEDGMNGWVTIGNESYGSSRFELKSERQTTKQQRYTDENGKDLIDEWAERYPIEIFRVIMWCQIEKYHRRLGKKDDVLLEVLKIADYAKRWADVEAERAE